MTNTRANVVEAADTLIADLYRAATGELPWGEPLAALRALFSAWGVHLHAVRLATGTVAFSYEVGGFPPEGVLAYVREYHRIDPRAALVARLGLGEWISCHQHFDDAFVARDRFYQDFLIPYGGRYVSAAKVHEDAEIVAILGIHRGRGMQPLTGDEVALAARMGRHVSTALGMWRRQRRLLEERLLGNAALDQLPHPVMLIDEQQRLHHANAAARRLLQANRALRLHEGALQLASPPCHHELLLALRRLRIGGGQSYRDDTPPVGRAIVRLGAPRCDHFMALVISRLRPDETMGAFGQRDLAMVLVHDLRRRAPVDRFVAASIFGFTPAEAAVAVAVAEGRTPADIAAEHGVARSTIRAQLNSVFAKMGVSRQAEVAGALASLPSAERPMID
ncbi:MAG: helix-turn-helix transcriptional regulator [Burkholderiaceae bacterium]|nr:helix-turn-helix transcriptional regulator [Burkholderiaceae bacterium]